MTEEQLIDKINDYCEEEFGVTDYRELNWHQYKCVVEWLIGYFSVN